MLFITELSLILCIFSVIICIACFYVYIQNKSIRADLSHALPIVQIVKILGKICPVSLSNEWHLLPHDLVVSRCWCRSFPLKILDKKIDVYGSSTLIEAHSLFVFKMISNTSHQIPSITKTSSLKLFENPSLKGDDFMRTAKIVNQFNEIESYRFSHLGTNKLGWILFWNAKKVQLSFFLVQPSKKYEKDQCLLTHIFGGSSKVSQKNIIQQLVFNVDNIKTACEIASAEVVPFQFSDYLYSKSNSIKNLTSTSTSLDETDFDFVNKIQCIKSEQSSPSSESLSLVPYIQFSISSSRRLRNFELSMPVLKNSNENISVVPSKVASEKPIKPSRKSVLKGVSLLKKSSKLGKSLSLEKVTTDMKSLKANDDGVILKSNHTACSEESGNSLHHAKKSQSASDIDSLLRKEQSFTTEKHLSDSSVSPESTMFERTSSQITDSSDEIKPKLTEMQEFEILLHHSISDCQFADIKTKGNYCASVLQSETLDAFSSNLQSTLEDKTNGIWVFHSHTKGLTVLSKQSTYGSMKVFSYASEVELPLKSSDVWNFLRNPRSRFICDESVKKVDILEEVSADQKIIYVYHETSYLLKRDSIDFCILHTERLEKSKQYIALCSLEFENCPLMDGTVRGSLLPSGFVIEATGPHNEYTNLKFLYQVLANSASNIFIHELGNCIPQSVFNLKQYLMLGQN